MKTSPTSGRAEVRRPLARPWVLLLLAAGCQTRPHPCPPADLLRSDRPPPVAVDGAGDTRPHVEPDVIGSLTSRLRRTGPQGCPSPPGRKVNILALSGGGMYGAYMAGVLSGWSASGRRPTFDVVTGVSTGALLATYAFLGPEYDAAGGRLYTTVCRSDVYRRRPPAALLWSSSAADSAPLRRLIASHVDEGLLRAVACAHASGRRLYVGTTSLDARRLVIWDMGALAGRGRLELYRQVLLASASAPGFFPPVPIDIEVNGQHFTELHADGGTTTQVFVPAAALGLDMEAVRRGPTPLGGSHVYLLIAGKLYADPECVEPRVREVARAGLRSLLASQTRNDLLRIYTLALLAGMDYHLNALPQDFPVSSDSLELDPEQMQRLYAEGYHNGVTGQGWRGLPPGTRPSEQELPRTGTRLLAPVVIPEGAVWR